MYSDEIVGINISGGLFLFSQSRVKLSVSLTNKSQLDCLTCKVTEQDKLPKLVNIMQGNNIRVFINSPLEIKKETKSKKKELKSEQEKLKVLIHRLS